jgi:sulfate permease, SulP family
MKAAPFFTPYETFAARPSAFAALWRALVAPRETQAVLVAALLTLVTVAPYASLVGAPLGPLALAPAVLSGLIGTVIGGLVAAANARRPVQLCSPRASVCIVIGTAVAGLHSSLGDGTSAVALLASTMLCLLLAAGLQWLFGTCRLGRLMRMVPHPVSAGFMAGIAVELAGTQLPRLLGTSIGQIWQGPALAVGGVAIGVIVLMCAIGRHKLAIPAGLLAGVLVHAALSATGLVARSATLPTVSLDTLPLFHPSALWQWLQGTPTWAVLPAVLTFALAIALVNSMETLATGMALEELTHKRFDADRALRASALGSLASVLLGGLPVAGSTAVSMAAHRAGARGRTTALLIPLVVLAVAALGAPLLAWVPMAAVAGVLLAVSAQLVLPHVSELLTQRRLALAQGREPGGDLAVAALVCVVLLFAGVGLALAAGVLAAAALVASQMRARLVARHYWPGDPHGRLVVPPNTCVLEVAQPLFFATVERLVDSIEAAARSVPRLVLDLTHGHTVDATAHRILARCAQGLKARDCDLVLVTPANEPQPSQAAQAAGLQTYSSVASALRAIQSAAPERVQNAAFASQLPCPELAAAQAWQYEALAELNAVVGPIARTLVKRVAAHARDREHLCRLVAAELRSQSHRRAFLRRMAIAPEAAQGARP